MIEEAHNQGLNAAADRYPYLRTSTGLAAYFPAHLRAKGAESLARRLEAPEVRNQLKDFFQDDEIWERIFVAEAFSDEFQTREGQSIARIAEQRGQPRLDTAIEILRESEGRASVTCLAMNDQDTDLILAHPLVAIGSDSAVRASYGPLAGGVPHPRGYGTCPRILGEYVRERRLIPLGEAVRKMTSLPAGILGLERRGRLEPGYYADVVVFDPLTVRDEATYETPHCYPKGIEYVIVNGQVVIDEGRHTGVCPGAVLECKG